MTITRHIPHTAKLPWALFCLMAISLLLGCDDDPVTISKEELVIEGWIADGGHPVVIVSSTLPITEEDMSVDDLKKYIAQWARVGITTEDGKTIYLTGRYNEDYFPPYIFTTLSVTGKVGASYRLTVDWRNHHAEATTTIPESIPIDNIWYEPCSDNDTLHQVMIHFQDSPARHDHYLLFSREIYDPLNPQLCLFGILDDALFPSAEVTTSARRGGLLTDFKSYTPYYCIGDQVEVSLMHVDSITYNYWRGFSDAKQLGRSMLFNVSTPLDGNISGGHGIWYGYGISKRTIRVK